MYIKYNGCSIPVKNHGGRSGNVYSLRITFHVRIDLNTDYYYTWKTEDV
jgi:hypothetical protein